ncbi:MAG: TauD/TfdA family dioxygenase [Pseudomonadales bacterium]|nr:TauD/TfdA family dioxygenase [Pseudomonadales bacterium]
MTLRVRPLTPRFGAEIFGVDLRSPVEAQMQAIREAFARYKVLAFRDQALAPEDHKAFARRFGELHVHPSHRLRRSAADPEIFRIHTTPDSAYTNGECWHTDVSCEPIPPMGSMLLVRELPGESGGDTLFADMTQAFAALSAPMQAFLRTLTAVHDGRKDLANYNVVLRDDQPYPKAEHPVVVRHPVTGDAVLFVNRAFTVAIPQLSPVESDALLEMLWQHAEHNPRFHCRVRWEPGTLVFWDNHATWHHAVWDYHPHSRRAERVSIEGRAPLQSHAGV